MPGLPLQDCPLDHHAIGQDVPHLRPNRFDLNRSANLCRESANHFFKNFLHASSRAEVAAGMRFSRNAHPPERLSTTRLEGIDKPSGRGAPHHASASERSTMSRTSV